MVPPSSCFAGCCQRLAAPADAAICCKSLVRCCGEGVGVSKSVRLSLFD